MVDGVPGKDRNRHVINRIGLPEPRTTVRLTKSDLYPKVGPVALRQCADRLDGCSFGRRVKRGAQGFALLGLSSVCFSEQGEALRSAPHVRRSPHQPVTRELWAKIRTKSAPLGGSPIVRGGHHERKRLEPRLEAREV